MVIDLIPLPVSLIAVEEIGPKAVLLAVTLSEGGQFYLSVPRKTLKRFLEQASSKLEAETKPSPRR